MPIPGLVAGQPLELLTATVARSQTNALGHLRAAQYVAVFDDAIMEFFPRTGLADRELKHAGASPFLMDLHACYLSELGAGEAVHVAYRHLEHDPRRARAMLLMRAAADGRPAATVELLLINMHISERKPVAWSASQMALWDELAGAHAAMPPPLQAGRAIGALAKSR
jgi:acyl-CoA thioester hydrolase